MKDNATILLTTRLGLTGAQATQKITLIIILVNKI
jgi:hypothetical protein